MIDNSISEVLKIVEAETGISRVNFIGNSRKPIFLVARINATKLLIEKTQLSDEGIAEVLGVSKSSASTYRNYFVYHRKN